MAIKKGELLGFFNTQAVEIRPVWLNSGFDYRRNHEVCSYNIRDKLTNIRDKFRQSITKLRIRREH